MEVVEGVLAEIGVLVEVGAAEGVVPLMGPEVEPLSLEA